MQRLAIILNAKNQVLAEALCVFFASQMCIQPCIQDKKAQNKKHFIRFLLTTSRSQLLSLKNPPMIINIKNNSKLNYSRSICLPGYWLVNPLQERAHLSTCTPNFPGKFTILVLRETVFGCSMHVKSENKVDKINKWLILAGFGEQLSITNMDLDNQLKDPANQKQSFLGSTYDLMHGQIACQTNVVMATTYLENTQRRFFPDSKGIKWKVFPPEVHCLKVFIGSEEMNKKQFF
ncbi:hypothetical protein EGR_07437 [Echinococcus granulosus]|uniref:Uncharacterized protein n=1 Tax=Echinococcus granulosus TaxID=6210 RepID=W6UAY0_ECHGR|nr:hypothetical protein EGR_07437 [Echinococcus granulosus]EUB57696.1 hypothetical protein EGR_07437 [Echinococcus granulosus]